MKSLDTFAFRAIPSLNKRLVLELTRAEYLDRRENVLALGHSGTGKTHLALGLGVGRLSERLSGAELLFEIFSQRYEQASTLVTSNLPFNEWTEIFGSERLTGALLDRLTHHVHILELNGDSYRLAHSQHARKDAAAPAS